MPLIDIDIDLDPITMQLAELRQVIEVYSIPTVANSHKERIVAFTKSGLDADGQLFPPYSTEWAERRAAAGFDTETKTLAMGQGRLYEPELIDDALTYRDDLTGKIAHGQMYHKGWSYHHNFFDVSEQGNEEAADVLADRIQEAID